MPNRDDQAYVLYSGHLLCPLLGNVSSAQDTTKQNPNFALDESLHTDGRILGRGENGGKET